MTSSFTRFKSPEPAQTTTEPNNLTFQDIQKDLFGKFAILLAIVTTLAAIILGFIVGTTVPISAVITITIIVWIPVFPNFLPYQLRVGMILFIMSGLALFFLFGNNLISGAIVQLMLAVIMASVFLNRRLTAVLIVLYMLIFAAWIGLVYTGTIVQNSTALSEIARGGPWNQIAFRSGFLTILIAGIMYALTSNLQQLLARQRTLTQAVTENRNSLESQVREQTKLLDLTVQVGRTLSGLSEPQQLLEEVVGQIQNAFGYYHVQVYLWNENKQQLEIAGGTGEAGRTLLIGNHKLPAGRGIVGTAAASQRPVLVQDVKQDPNWVPNTLLPETKTESAVPILYQNELLGVLDVQHNIIGHLQPSDVQLLTTLASQIAVALRNAAVYKQVQEQLKQQAIINEMGQTVQLAPNITFTLQTAARQLYQALDAQRLGITLLPKVLVPHEKSLEGDQSS